MPQTKSSYITVVEYLSTILWTQLGNLAPDTTTQGRTYYCLFLSFVILPFFLKKISGGASIITQHKFLNRKKMGNDLDLICMTCKSI